ncbi:hypothetical protein EJB05_26898, partial [Eragrostis curvula]
MCEALDMSEISIFMPIRLYHNSTRQASSQKQQGCSAHNNPRVASIKLLIERPKADLRRESSCNYGAAVAL